MVTRNSTVVIFSFFFQLVVSSDPVERDEWPEKPAHNQYYSQLLMFYSSIVLSCNIYAD